MQEWTVDNIMQTILEFLIEFLQQDLFAKLFCLWQQHDRP